MRVRALFALVAATLLVLACNTKDPSENLGITQEALGVLTNGKKCVDNSQCASGFCVDAVCCSSACGNGARDNIQCSEIYGPIPNADTHLEYTEPNPGLNGQSPHPGQPVGASGDPFPGTCIVLQPGDPCGQLTRTNPCQWQGKTVTNGGTCPSSGTQSSGACYTCTPATAANDCGGGLPACINNGCVKCNADNGTGGAQQCPDPNNPACTPDGSCVQCSGSNASACTGACNTTTDTCTGCTSDFGVASVAPCSSDKPVCHNPGSSGVCVQCDTSGCPGGECNSAKCTGTTPYCDIASDASQFTCVQCNTAADCQLLVPPQSVCNNHVCGSCTGDFGSGPGGCPTAADPACVAGACLQCSSTNKTACPSGICLNNVCVECLTGADCPMNKPFCNGGVCSAGCTTNAQCTIAPNLICNTAVMRCVQCLGNGDCSGGAPFCDTTNNRDVCVQCRTAADCPTSAPVCNSSGSCVPCNANNGGGGNSCPDPNKPACETNAGPTQGQCFQCTAADLQICNAPGSTTHVCNTSSHTCVQCTPSSAAACTGTTPVCNGASSTCVGCNGDNGSLASAQCPSPTLPACIAAGPLQGSCKECSGSDVVRCLGTGLPVCDTTADPAQFTCVQCNTNLDCAGLASGVCNTATHVCTAGCTSDSNCSGTTPVCNTATMQCVQCINNTQCADPTPLCDTTANRDQCVQCLSDANCPTSAPVCTGGSCFACDGDRGSGTTHACKSAAAPACVKTGADTGKCVQCTTADAVLCTGGTPACNDTSHTCVQCASNTQCSGRAPICNAAGTCIACSDDFGAGTPAACFQNTKPACLKTGSSSGACAQCDATNGTQCTGQTPVCDLASDAKIDTCVQCNTDAECTGPMGKCNTVQHVCTIGCTTDANCSGATPACKLPDGFCVECTMTNTTHCKAPTPVCDVPATVCVQCTKGSDCPADKPVCDAQTKTCTATCTDDNQCPSTAPHCDGSARVCVQCETSKDCPPDKPVCDSTTHTCGTTCTKSTDCPGDKPVCDPQSHTCEQCSMTSDCKGGQVCDSMTHTCGSTCGSSKDCPADQPVCSPTTHNCVGCVSNTDCPNTAPLCDGTTNKCVNPDDFSIEGGGCACSTVPSSTGRNAVGVLAGIALAITAFARRRRR